jgi:hypothetical protein
MINPAKSACQKANASFCIPLSLPPVVMSISSDIYAYV